MIFRLRSKSIPPASAHADTLSRDLSTRSFADSLGVRLYRGALVRTFLWELRSFYWRILLILRTRIDRRGVVCDPLPNVESQIRRQAQDACSADMRKLCACRPWLSQLDEEVFCRAWKQGAEWFFRSGYSRLPELKSDSYEIYPSYFMPSENLPR